MASIDSSGLMVARPIEPPGEYSPRAGRRFAFTVGAAFAVIASILHLRGYRTSSAVTGALAAILLLGGAAVPGRLQPVERLWMSFAHALSRVTTPLFMGIVYFLVLSPVGLIRRAMGRNALVRPADASSFWIRREAPTDGEARRRKMERQF